MNESAMNFEGVILSPQKEAVRIFFNELWDRADKTLIPELFHPDFTFRGSLGPELRGYTQFAGYVDLVTGALGQYTSDILDMVEEANKVVCRLRYHGIHRGELLGHPPTNRHVWWYGTPFFIFNGSKTELEQLIGNAVPVNLGTYVANCINDYIEDFQANRPMMVREPEFAFG